MKRFFTILICLLFSAAAFGQAPTIPIDFESNMLTYTWSDFAGGVGSVIDNPDMSGINTSSKVGQMVKFEGEVFGGSTLALAGPIDFGDNNAIKMKVWANRVGAPVTFKLEGPTPVEINANTTVANAWEELTFSLAGFTGFEFTAITIIYDLGTVGDGSADFTLYFDDIELTTETVEEGVQLPIDFESTTLTYTWSDFAGGVGSVIDNPDMSGINTSSKVGQMVKFEGEVFGGSTLALAGPVDFGDNNAIKMKVWANRVDAPVTFKLEGPAPVEVVATTTVANAWEELTFSFAGLTGGVYTAITIIYDLGTVGDGSADFTLYFDDIELTTLEGGINLPIDFEDPDLNYAFSDFGGGVGMVIDNPDASGINTSAKVAEYVKFEGEVFGGTTLPLGGAIDFGTNNAIKMKVWANRVGANVLFKLEGPAPVEVSVPTTVANQWEELTFGFAGLTGGAYTGITIILDLGVVGDGGPDFTMYFDDIELTTATGGVNLPITFESMDLTYTFSDFAGGVAAVIDNPDASGINTSSKVVQLDKLAGEVFGGSTLALGSPINFGDNTEIEMKVWAPRTDAPMLLKLEGPTPVEINMTPTVANEWTVLTYDFSGFTGNVYTGITLIYDLGVVGDGGDNFRIYLDDIQFPGTVSTNDLTELEVTYFPNPVQDYLTLSAREQLESIEIYDLNGRQVYQELLESYQRSVDLSNLPAGPYVIRVRVGGQRAVAKFIKN